MRTIEEVEKELDEAERQLRRVSADAQSTSKDIRQARQALRGYIAELAALKGADNDRAG